MPDEPIAVPDGRRARSEVDRQLRQQVQGADPDTSGPGRVPQRGGRVDHARDRSRTRSSERPASWGSAHRCSPTSPRRSGPRRCGCWSWRTSTAPWPRGSWRSPTSSTAWPTSPGASSTRRPRPSTALALDGLSLIQEGLRGVVRLPDGTAHSLDGGDFPIPVMGKTGTTSSFRDALFVGSTYGPQGITVAVRIGFDDNRALGREGDRRRARRCRSSARSCSASTRTSWWDRRRSSPERSRRASTTTWRCRRRDARTSPAARRRRPSPAASRCRQRSTVTERPS